MSAQTTLKLNDQLCFSLYSASIAVNRLYKPLLDELGITYPQYLVLSALWEQQDGLPVGGIASRLSLEPSTVTPLVKRLEQAGLVTRQRNPSDERQVQVQLTQEGKALQEKTGCLTNRLLERSGMTGVDLTSLNQQVTQLVQAISS
ncbi:MAG: MarR family winged helix-turn-helix transcriptional regulator [Bradyrhizobium sp.]